MYLTGTGENKVGIIWLVSRARQTQIQASVVKKTHKATPGTNAGILIISTAESIFCEKG